jgi:hypothetical protein
VCENVRGIERVRERYGGRDIMRMCVCVRERERGQECDTNEVS